MSKKIKYSKELIIGAIGIAALLSIYLLINFFKGIDLFKAGERYYVRFDNIGQTTSSSPIYINGYKAGNVQGISYDFEDLSNVIVTIDIDKRLRIPTGSYAEVNNHMLGGSDISIKLANSDTYVTPGDTILGVLNKGIAGEMESTIPTINNMIPKVDSILTSLNTLLANPAINKSINNAEVITTELTETTAQLNALLENEIPQIINSATTISKDLQGVSSQIKEVDYKELFTTLQATVSNIEEITAALNSGEGTAGKLLKDSELYEKLDSTCAAANALLTDMKENPKRYVHFSVFGNKDK